MHAHPPVYVRSWKVKAKSGINNQLHFCAKVQSPQGTVWFSNRWDAKDAVKRRKWALPAFFGFMGKKGLHGN